MSNIDVVVTGLGATTPLGGDVASTWDAMLAGRSGVKVLTQEWAAQLPVRIAASLAVEPSEVIERVKLRRLDRSEAIALIAARQAWADSGLADSGLAEILEEVAGVNPDDVAEGKSFTDDLDVDSLSMVEVVVAAEEKFGVKIPDNEVQNLKTVGDAVGYIEANH